MPSTTPRDITRLLLAWSDGDDSALRVLVPLIHDELHRLASHYMRGERGAHTLQTTALVNEVFLRLIDVKSVRWQNRAHFFGVSANLMRRVLVDFARSRDTGKRGGGAVRLSLDDALTVSCSPDPDLVALDDSLNALAVIDARKARVIELRFFGGLTVLETAEVLHISQETVLRDWKLAKVWLVRELGGEQAHDA